MEINNIALGILNSTKKRFGVADQKVEDLALKRLEVCAPCDKLFEDKLGKRCGMCKCVLGWMSRSNKLCQAGKWDNI